MKPPYLKQGDKVAIVATAKKLEPAHLDGADCLIGSWGLTVVCGKHLYATDRQFAGTDAQRAADLQQALDNPDIKAIVFARGGYGTVRIIDRVDWTVFHQRPKWLCGFSDLTVVHGHVNRTLGIETLHSSMPVFFADGVANTGSDTLRDALFGNHRQVAWAANNLDRTGQATAPLVGGNLSVICSLIGTPGQPRFEGSILFLEDLTEYLYHLDRMMTMLRRGGHLDKLAGLVVGQFTDMMDNPVPFGKSPYEIIAEAVAGRNYPMAFGAPIGHVKENVAVFCGAKTALKVADDGNVLVFP